jgi:hypothetical protein
MAWPSFFFFFFFLSADVPPETRRQSGSGRVSGREGPAAVLFVFRLLQASSIAGGVAELSKALDPGGVERHVVARCCSVVVGRPAGQVRSSSRQQTTLARLAVHCRIACAEMWTDKSSLC